MADQEEQASVNLQGPVCPRPLSHEGQIVIGHGSGGKMTKDLIEGAFYPPFENEVLLCGDDAAVVEPPGGGRLAVTTDAHIVAPLFFPGGDIGRLAVAGTVNDLAVMGAEPLWMTASFILEEGLPMQTLARVVESMRRTAQEGGIKIIAGDTKVAERGKADGIFISTSGVGWIPKGREVGGANAKPGDAVLLSGSIGDHGIAVLAARGDLAFETSIESDVAPLQGLVERIFQATREVRTMRDPTRGGLATALNEIARQSQVGILLEESKLAVQPGVQSACELLGFDPLFVANEGKLVVIVAEEVAGRALAAMQDHPLGAEARRIGSVVESPPGKVLMRTGIGGTRVVEMLSGEMLPRIC